MQVILQHKALGLAQKVYRVRTPAVPRTYRPKIRWRMGDTQTQLSPAKVALFKKKYI